MSLDWVSRGNECEGYFPLLAKLNASLNSSLQPTGDVFKEPDDHPNILREVGQGHVR